MGRVAGAESIGYGERTGGGRRGRSGGGEGAAAAEDRLLVWLMQLL